MSVATVVAAVLTGASTAAALAVPTSTGHGTAARGAAVAGASLAGVSCAEPTWCMAVGRSTDNSGGRHALAQIWNGSAWRVLKRVPGHSLGGVSCSSAQFCMASGGPTGTEVWNGGSWHTIASPPFGTFGASCGSRTLCMDTYRGLVRSWNGTTWRLWKRATDFCSGNPPGACGFASVACGSAKDCVAVGTQTVDNAGDQRSIAVHWNGSRWTTAPPPAGDGNPEYLNAVSCAGGFCMAGGGAYQQVQNGDVAVAGAWHAKTKTWNDVSPTSLGVICTGYSTCVWTSDISCAGPSNCMAFGPSGNQAWNGSAWSAAPSVSAGPGSSLSTVSCRGTICLAVGYRTIGGAKHTLAELWNGSTWQIIATPTIG
jgi:hypothetical protein